MTETTLEYLMQTDPAEQRQALYLVAAGWMFVITATIFAYWPGLAGPFLLDDFGSVKALGDYGGVTDWESFKYFVFSRDVGPLGRPVSFLSFLIDANNWPADAWPFKRTNLVIHLLNGVLLAVVVTLILKCLAIRDRDIRWIALVSAAIWLLHPFLVSTTLYVVQRMAQLSAMFMFAGLSTYLYGRLLLRANPVKAYLVMSAAIGIFTLLAMLSKENGILLPVLIGVIELTVIASQRQRLPGLNRYWAGVFIVLPAAVIAIYLVVRVLGEDVFESLPLRDFTLYERILTQGRVLIDYLQHWYLPKLYTTGVFQDHFIKSTGLFSPVTTALSFVFHIAAITLAFIKRRQFPLFSMAVLFFYASHILESTVLNLELYFEHRNYVAAALLFLPLVELAHRKATPRVFVLLSLFVILIVGSFTRYSATVWKSLPSMVETAALSAPTSARAQSQYAKLLFYFDRPAEAIATIDRAISNIPQDNQLLLANRLYFLCAGGLLDVDAFDATAEKLAVMPFDTRLLKAHNEFAKEVVIGSCPQVTAERLDTMYSQMLHVPHNSDSATREYAHIQFLLGYVRVYSGKPRAALAAFESSLDARPGAEQAMAMAGLMASIAYNQEALVLADRALRQLRKEIAETPRLMQTVKESDISEFQESLRLNSPLQRDAGMSDRVD